MDNESKISFSIAGHTIFPSRNLIVTSKGERRIEPKIMRVLMLLVQENGSVVSKEQILNTVWEDTYVSDEVISRAISELRKALGDDARSPKIIETIPKKGYRLIAEVQKDTIEDQHAGKEEKGFIKKNLRLPDLLPLLFFSLW